MPSTGRGVPAMVIGPKSNEYELMAGHPVATTRSSKPHRCSAAIAGACSKWVDTVSLGKVARSTNRTRHPRRASTMAVGAPAHRAPITIASYSLIVFSYVVYEDSDATRIA